jgi:predicted MFS family arabinose efflux permease
VLSGFGRIVPKTILLHFLDTAKLMEAVNDYIKRQHEHLLWVLSAATFLIFFQAFMVAPLIPRLAAVFGVSDQAIGLIVPAYMIAYGISTLFYGLLSDRIGRGPILLASLLAFVVLTLLTATSQSASQMIF